MFALPPVLIALAVRMLAWWDNVSEQLWRSFCHARFLWLELGPMRAFCGHLDAAARTERFERFYAALQDCETAVRGVDPRVARLVPAWSLAVSLSELALFRRDDEAAVLQALLEGRCYLVREVDVAPSAQQFALSHLRDVALLDADGGADAPPLRELDFSDPHEWTWYTARASLWAELCATTRSRATLLSACELAAETAPLLLLRPRVTYRDPPPLARTRSQTQQRQQPVLIDAARSLFLKSIRDGDADGAYLCIEPV